MTGGETTVLLAGLILLVLFATLKGYLEQRDKPRPIRPLSSWTSIFLLSIGLAVLAGSSLWFAGFAAYNLARQVELMRSGAETTGVVEHKWRGGRGQGLVVAYRFGELSGEDRTWADTYRSAKVGEPITVYYATARPHWNALERWSFFNSALYTLFWSIMCGVIAVALYREHVPVAWTDIPGPRVDPDRVRQL